MQQLFRGIELTRDGCKREKKKMRERESEYSLTGAVDRVCHRICKAGELGVKRIGWGLGVKLTVSNNTWK